MKKSGILFSFLFLLSLSLHTQTTGEGPFNQLIIRGVTLINGDGAPPISPVDIVVENNIIEEIKVVGYPGAPIDTEKRPNVEIGGKRTGRYRDVFASGLCGYAWSYRR